MYRDKPIVTHIEKDELTQQVKRISSNTAFSHRKHTMSKKDFFFSGWPLYTPVVTPPWGMGRERGAPCANNLPVTPGPVTPLHQALNHQFKL